MPLAPTPPAADPTASRRSRADRVARRGRWGIVAALLLTAAGIVLERLGVLDWRAGVAMAQGYADRPWLAPALALITALLYATSLPGSMMVWVLGILFPPQVAAPLFVAGGVAGAFGAYSLARGAGEVGSTEEHRLLRLLARRSDFVTLVAVRVAPGIPHSAINLAAGALRLPLVRFLASAALGLAIKGGLYVTAIHQAARVATVEEAISWRTVAPLVLLAATLLAVPPLLRRWRQRGGAIAP